MLQERRRRLHPDAPLPPEGPTRRCPRSVHARTRCNDPCLLRLPGTPARRPGGMTEADVASQADACCASSVVDVETPTFGAASAVDVSSVARSPAAAALVTCGIAGAPAADAGRLRRAEAPPLRRTPSATLRLLRL